MAAKAQTRERHEATASQLHARGWSQPCSREPPAASDYSLLPAQLGDYRVIAPLRRGGMGAIYEGRDGAGNAVAIKVPRTARADHRDAVLREIELLQRLRGTRAVRMLASGEASGMAWFAMPLLRGNTLAKTQQLMWREVQRPVERTTCVCDGVLAEPAAAAGQLPRLLRIAHRSAQALSSVHRLGVAHGDIKPENMILERQRVVLIDFGLARRVEDDAAEPDACGADTVGTVAYMAPEQLRGEAATPHSDLYALGCVLYELLVGGRPFSGAPHQIRYQHLCVQPLAASSLVSGLPREVELLIRDLMHKDPARRGGSSHDLEHRLKALL